MITRHPYRAVTAVLAVALVCLFVGGMIGQYNDGPWGGLPEWLGATMWFGFLASLAVLLVLAVYLLVTVRRHRGHRPHVT